MRPTGGFQRPQRLLKSSEFKAVFAHQQRLGSRYFTVLIKPNTYVNARLGLAISKKNVKLATARNRIKRIIRESFRSHQTLLTGLDCVVLAKKGVDTAEHLKLFKTLAYHWHQAVQQQKTS